MQLGLMVEPQVGGTYDELLGLARFAEQRGLEVFARSDHYLSRGPAPSVTDALATLAGLARDTSDIALSVLVTPLSFRHPAVIAKTAATIDEMSGGRFELGVGTGWMELEDEAFGIRLPPLAERFERLGETLGYLRAAFGEGAPGFRGSHYTLDEIDVRPKPQHLPIVVGGSGKRKTPTLAGRYADEFNSFVDDPDAWQARVAVMREAAVAAGRDPDAILLSIPSQVVVGADQADYRERLGAAAAERDLEPAEFESRLAARGIPHGEPAQVREAAARFEALGLGRFYLQLFQALPDIDTDNVGIALDALRG